MAINFPTSLDTFTNPTATDQVASVTVPHATQHANANDAIEALEAKVGVDGSAVTTSHDYKLSGVTGSDKAASVAGSEILTNKTLTAPKLANGGFIADANGNELIEGTTVANATNHVGVSNNSTGNAPIVEAKGSDTDIDLSVKGKGAGKVKLGAAGLKFPNTDGTVDYVLKTDGAGNLSWVAQSSIDANLVPPYTFYASISGIQYESVYNQYTDSTQFAFATRTGTTIYYNNSSTTGGPQTRDVTTDWASAAEITSTVTLGAYLYLFLRDASNNYRVYRYAKGALSSGGTLMTIATQAFATTGGANVIMTSNGTNFYFNYKGGNNASDRIISKYTLSGTTLTYASDITCGASSNVANQFVIDSSENIYGYYRSVDFGGDDKIRKYNSSGTLQFTSVAFGSYGKWRAIFSNNSIIYLERYVNTDAASHNNVYYLTRIFI